MLAYCISGIYICQKILTINQSLLIKKKGKQKGLQPDMYRRKNLFLMPEPNLPTKRNFITKLLKRGIAKITNNDCKIKQIVLVSQRDH